VALERLKYLQETVMSVCDDQSDNDKSLCKSERLRKYLRQLLKQEDDSSIMSDVFKSAIRAIKKQRVA
jgi:hypothetical protein